MVRLEIIANFAEYLQIINQTHFNNKMTKKFLYGIMMLAMTAMMCTLPACNDNDDDEPDLPKLDTSKKGWFKAEGKTTNFNYGYYMVDNYDGDVEEELVFCTYNVLELIANPKKAIGKTVSMAEFSRYDSFDYNNIDCSAFINAKIVAVEYDDEDGMDYPVTEGGVGYEIEDQSFTFKINSSTYSVSGSGLTAECWTEDRYGNEKDLGTAKVDFSFSGDIDTLFDPNDYDDLYGDTRSIEIVKVTDPKVIRFIKSIAHPSSK